MKKLLCAASALLVALSLASCHTETPPAADTAEPVTTEAPYTGPWLTLAEGGKTNYSIIYPEGCGKTIVTACQDFRARFKEVTGVRPDCTDDVLPAWMEEPEFEILIGRTGREASEKAWKELSDLSDYIIRADGMKLVVIGGSDDATVAALEMLFSEKIISADDGGKYVLRGDFNQASVTTHTVKFTKLSDDGQYLTFTMAASNGQEIPCRLSFSAGGWRMQSAQKDGTFDTGAGQMLAEFFDEAPLEGGEKLSFTETDVLTVKEPGGASFVISASPFSFKAYTPSGKEAVAISSLAVSEDYTVVRGSLLEKEALFGTGERFNTVNQRGKIVDLTAIDIWCGIEGNSYMPIPTLISSRGSGLFVNRYERMIMDLGATDPNSWEIKLHAAPLDLYVFPTENPADVLRGYCEITGYAPQPADWMYGTTVCRYSPDFKTVQGVMDMVDAMEKNDFPWDNVILEGWGAYEQNRWTELTSLVETLHGMGKKVLVYTTTGRAKGTALPLAYHVLQKNISNLEKSVQLPDTDSYNPADNPNPSTSRYVDITSDEAWKWWVNNVWDRLINKVGIDGAKIDFCEQFPEHVDLFFDDPKAEASGAHHWYPTFYNKLMYDLFNTKEDGGMVLARGGGIGAQRYPFIWAGDQRREFKYLDAQLRACLSSGMSGVPFMSFDAAAYRPAQNGDSEAHVFSRGIEFTAFTANIQTHGTVTRPYDFDDDTKKIYHDFAWVHEALRPYIEEQGIIATETGMPLMRHLSLLWWEDETVWNIDNEYMLGEGLLVCPVLNSKMARDIYLPEGEWIHYLTGETYKGGQWLKNFAVAIDEIPVFVKADVKNETLDKCLTEIREILN